MARATKEQLAERKLDKEIEQCYYRLASGVQISVMDINPLFRDVKADLKAGKGMDEAVAAAVARYRKN